MRVIIFIIISFLFYAPVYGAPSLNFKSSTPEALKKAEAPAPPGRLVTLRDPFTVDFVYLKPEVQPEEPGQEKPPAAPKPVLMLQGIFLSGDMRIAIIDDKVVTAGSRVAAGWTVAQIKPDMVILSKDGKIKTLLMKVGVE